MITRSSYQSSAMVRQDAIYADGVYTATGYYGGLPSSITVTVTLVDGIISAVEVTPHATNPTSLDLQQRFAAAVPAVVVGKPIDEVNVGRLAGSSGRPEGFNAAIQQIKEQANHTLQTSQDLGEFGCHDSQVGHFSGWINSDTRPHDPAPPGYNPELSSSPLWFMVYTGFLDPTCINNVLVTLAMSGATAGCYELTFQPFLWQQSQSALVDENGQAILRLGKSSYSDSSWIDVKVEKVCGPPETVYFEADFHL